MSPFVLAAPLEGGCGVQWEPTGRTRETCHRMGAQIVGTTKVTMRPSRPGPVEARQRHALAGSTTLTSARQFLERIPEPSGQSRASAYDRSRVPDLSGRGKGGGAEVIRPGDAFLPMRAGRPTRLLARRRPARSFNHLVRAA